MSWVIKAGLLPYLQRKFEKRFAAEECLSHLFTVTLVSLTDFEEASNCRMIMY